MSSATLQAPSWSGGEGRYLLKDGMLRNHSLLEVCRLSGGMYPAAALVEVVKTCQIGLEVAEDVIDANIFAIMAVLEVPTRVGTTPTS